MIGMIVALMVVVTAIRSNTCTDARARATACVWTRGLSEVSVYRDRQAQQEEYSRWGQRRRRADGKGVLSVRG